MIATDELTDGKLVDLPKEAGNIDSIRFEPNLDWLRNASPVEQKTAMWRWFASHFEELTIAVPHDGEGNFLFADNRQVQADGAISGKFAGLVPEAVLSTFVADVVSKAGRAWTPRTIDKMAG